MTHTHRGQDEIGSTPQRWPWIALLLITSAAYWPTINSPYVADDFGLFSKPMPNGVVGILKTHSKYVRPLPALMMRGEYLLWGSWTFGSHLTSLVLHLVTTLLVGALAKRLAAGATVAFCAAALFGLHPLHAGAVSWLSARFDLCCAMLGMVALLKFDDHLLSGSKRTLAISLLSFLGALLSKELAVAFLPIFLLWAYVRPGPTRVKLWKPLAAFGILLVSYGWMRTRVIDGIPPLGRMDLTSWSWIQDAICIPLGLLALPLDRAQWAAWSSPFDMALLSLLTVTLVWNAIATMRAGRLPSRAAVFGLGLLLISILPLAPVVHRLEGDVVPSRVLYTTSIGFCIVLGCWIGNREPGVRRLLLIAWMLLYWVGLTGNNLAWRKAGNIASEVIHQLEALVSARGDSFNAILIQDPPRFHNGAYVYLGTDLGHAIDLALGRDVHTSLCRTQPSPITSDLRMGRNTWLGFRWDETAGRMIDITARLRNALNDYHATEQVSLTWTGEQLRAWDPGGHSKVSAEGLSISAARKPIVLESPILPVNAAVLNIRAFVRRIGDTKRRPPRRWFVRWTGGSRTTDSPIMFRFLVEGEIKAIRIPAPPVGSVEDLEERELRVSLVLRKGGYELCIESITLATFPTKKTKRMKAGDRAR